LGCAGEEKWWGGRGKGEERKKRGKKGCERKMELGAETYTLMWGVGEREKGVEVQGDGRGFNHGR